MMSSNGNIFRVTGLCAGNSPATGEFPAQRPVTRSFDVFFDLHLNKRLSKQWRGWWFETPSCPLWRHVMNLPPNLAYTMSKRDDQQNKTKHNGCFTAYVAIVPSWVMTDRPQQTGDCHMHCQWRMYEDNIVISLMASTGFFNMPMSKQLRL